MKIYQPSMAKSSGVYCICVGAAFYIGSSRRLGTRISSHRTSLARGIHPNQKLQGAWNNRKELVALIVHECPIEELLPREDALIRDVFQMPGCCNSSETAYFNSKIGEITRARWSDQNQRQKLVAAMQGRTFSDETKQKMATAKTGALNPKARPCVINFQGESLTFGTGSEAARHFSVSQQAMEGWLAGRSSWPTASAPTRPQNRRLAGMTGSFVV